MKLSYQKEVRIIKRKQTGLSSAFIAKQFNVSKRRIEQIWAYYKQHRTYMPLTKQGRKPYREENPHLDRKILSINSKYKFGATYIAKYLRAREGIHIANGYVHMVLLNNDKAEENKNKKKRRKPWIRYERNHSLSAVHLDWHFSSVTEKWVCVVIDDASRRILSGGEYEEALQEYNIAMVDEANRKYSYIRNIREAITDHGSQFFANKKNLDGTSGQTQFQKFLDEKKIHHILCKYKHPQSNGKIEKWFHCYDLYREDFKSFDEFIEWYNNRPHGSLDFMTPEHAFWFKLQDVILGRFLSWAEKV